MTAILTSPIPPAEIGGGISAPSYRSVELFVGAGGLALGLHRAGFRPVLAIDNDPRSFETLTANASASGLYTADWGIRREDVHKLDYSEIGPTDLLAAGPPCQPFSIGGRLLLDDDERNLFPEVIRAARELKPRAFVLENVRGLLFPRTKPYFDYVIAQLRVPSRAIRPEESREEHYQVLREIPERDHEYRIAWRLLNAADYGLPQLRQRLVIVGTGAREPPWEWPPPTHGQDALVAALWGDEYWDEHEVGQMVRDAVRSRLPASHSLFEVGERWQTVRDLTRRLGPPHDSQDGDPAHAFIPGARLYRKHTGSTLDWPAKTVKAGVHGTPGGEHIVVLDDGSHRYFTVRECAALQGFPDDYLLPRYRTWALRLLGNAVPIALAEAIGHQLVEMLRHARSAFRPAP